MQIWNGSDEYCWRYRADTILTTDEQTDGRTDGQTDGQGETSVPLFNFVDAAGIIICASIYKLCNCLHAHVVMYASAHARAFTMHMSMCLHTCANLYMCVSATHTYVYICVRWRITGAYITHIRWDLFNRTFSCICVNKYILICVYICKCARM